MLNNDPGSLGSGPGSGSPHDTDEEWFESLTDIPLMPVVIHSVSLKLVLSQLLLQVNISFHLVSMSQLIPYSCCFVSLVKHYVAVFSKKALCE